MWVKPRDHKLVGESLAAVRKRAGITQQELAKRLGKPQSFVSAFEGGYLAAKIQGNRRALRNCGTRFVRGAGRCSLDLACAGCASGASNKRASLVGISALYARLFKSDIND